MRYTRWIFGALILFSSPLFSENQTLTTSQVLPQDPIPFRIRIEEADFSLPSGWHSGATAVHNGKWLLIAGRTNGMHGFNHNNNNFPPQKQNRTVYVIDPAEGTVAYRSLDDPESGLSQEEIDQLSVTSPQSCFNGETLYISGGYGVITETGTFDTKSTLTAIDLSGFINWVTKRKGTAKEHIRSTSHPLMKVTGGAMFLVDSHLSALLVFGQNFQGYYIPESEGIYTKQVQRFQIIDNGKSLYVMPLKSEAPNEDYRRRDLNVVPIMRNHEPSLLALSGVFTVSGGIWTVPVHIKPNGKTFMADPLNPETFKQGMNNYASASIGLYSKKTDDMYIVLPGGISFGYFDNGTFTTDTEFPFINQVTTVRINKDGKFDQYIMQGEYPVIYSTGSNPGNQLLFGAAAKFFPEVDLSEYANRVLRLDKLHEGFHVLGYIVGGIMSTVPNTNTISDSTASPYIFRVILEKE